MSRADTKRLRESHESEILSPARLLGLPPVAERIAVFLKPTTVDALLLSLPVAISSIYLHANMPEVGQQEREFYLQQLISHCCVVPLESLTVRLADGLGDRRMWSDLY